METSVQSRFVEKVSGLTGVTDQVVDLFVQYLGNCEFVIGLDFECNNVFLFFCAQRDPLEFEVVLAPVIANGTIVLTATVGRLICSSSTAYRLRLVDFE